MGKNVRDGSLRSYLDRSSTETASSFGFGLSPGLAVLRDIVLRFLQQLVSSLLCFRASAQLSHPSLLPPDSSSQILTSIMVTFFLTGCQLLANFLAFLLKGHHSFSPPRFSKHALYSSQPSLAPQLTAVIAGSSTSLMFFPSCRLLVFPSHSPGFTFGIHPPCASFCLSSQASQSPAGIQPLAMCMVRGRGPKDAPGLSLDTQLRAQHGHSDLHTNHSGAGEDVINAIFKKEKDAVKLGLCLC